MLSVYISYMTCTFRDIEPCGRVSVCGVPSLHGLSHMHDPGQFWLRPCGLCTLAGQLLDCKEQLGPRVGRGGLHPPAGVHTLAWGMQTWPYN